jgi:acetyltransferase-like isoleucine patch superfamily enzyme
VQSHIMASGGHVTIGDRVKISYGAAISAVRAVTIGADTRIGPFVVITDSDFHGVSNRSAAGEVGPVRIGSGVTIGVKVTILRGATIGDGATILSGSMVAGHIAPGATVRGVPAV